MSIKQLKTNEEITADQILLIDEEGKPQGVVSRDQALYLAYEKGYDLVLINENQTPPIAKLMDYGKYLYSMQKQLAKQKAHAHNQELKEVRISIKIGIHDLEVKTNQMKKFLERGDKVKVTVQLKGREMMFRNKVPTFLEKIKADTNATLEKPLERLGNRFSVILVKNQ